ncbi:MAG: hypothetical protein IPQ18_09190 [Saprospiraceae bacterium]|nr:hypothetical protein [Saprospiraceae bacterium]
MKKLNLLVLLLTSSLLYGQVGPTHFEFFDYAKKMENWKPLKNSAKLAEIKEYSLLSNSFEEGLKADTTIEIDGQKTELLISAKSESFTSGNSIITKKFSHTTGDLLETNTIKWDEMGKVVKILNEYADSGMAMYNEYNAIAYDDKNRFASAIKATCETCDPSPIKFTYRDDGDIDKVSMGLMGMGTLEITATEKPGMVFFEQKLQFIQDDSNPMIKIMAESAKNEINTFQRETKGDNYHYTYFSNKNSEQKLAPFLKEIRDKSFNLLETEKLSDGKTEINIKYTYNQSGGVSKIETLQNGELIIYENTYDEAGRPLIQYMPDGSKSIYKYDEKGNWTSLYNYSDPNTLNTITLRKVSY